MATYKVIQDIEAEDKLVGPLTLRQFVYGGIAALCAYLSFFALSKGAGVLLIFLVPPMFFTGFFAFPFGRDQPTEVWALAKIRFYIKSRKRLWDQSGVKDLVDITAPKRVERVYTNGLSTHEVQSRLNALASTLDSRGWAVKNSVNIYATQPGMIAQDSDRLVEFNAMSQQAVPSDVSDADDILDEQNNPRARQLLQMVTASTATRRQQLVSQLKQAIKAQPATPAPQATQAPPTQLPAPADYWFLNKPVDTPKPSGDNAVFADAKVVSAGEDEATVASIQGVAPVANEAELSDELRERQQHSQVALNNQHMKTIQPLDVQPAAQSAPTAPPPVADSTPAVPVTPVANPATMSLAGNNDLNIATIARIANKQDQENGEVVISLHRHDS